ncbi:MAG: ferredoxin--NADP reductase [Flavobacteriaceae bacterium]|nr:ferredoxin--NADP reductase [Flavobacteriaceae bacterium]
MSAFNLLNVASVEQLTADAVKISFEIPEALKKDYSFMPGQYVTLKTQLNGESITRSYSICSSPKDKYLSIGVKQIKNGTFSTYANTVLQVGDALSVSTPEGRFVIDKSEEIAHYLFIAAGSGITPIISMISHELARNSNTKCTLVFANQSPETAMFIKALKELQAEYPQRFKLQWVFSRANEAEAHFGRIDAAFLKFFTKKQQQRYDSIYLCGPQEMIETLSEALLELNYQKAQIKYELFQVTDTEYLAQKSAAAIAEVVLDDVHYEVSVQENQVVLDAVLAKDLDAPYSCQGGICSSCVARLTEGKVHMKANHVLTDQEIADGLILTCQAIPETPKISISYDDV